MAGEGVLQWIDDTELEHWGFAAAARAAVAAVAVGDPALQRFKEGGSAASQPVIFQVNAVAETCVAQGGCLLSYLMHTQSVRRGIPDRPCCLFVHCSAAPSWACFLPTTHSAPTHCFDGKLHDWPCAASELCLRWCGCSEFCCCHTLSCAFSHCSLIACIENGEGGAADRLLEDMLQSEVELFLKGVLTHAPAESSARSAAASTSCTGRVLAFVCAA